jgi:endonuclease/exonuclease/phosphatase family metal-dependent hydrolase
MLRRSVWTRGVLSVAIVTSLAVLMSWTPARPARAVATSFAVLQMNLCNSGVPPAVCYTYGRSVDEAVEEIHRFQPDLVTVQEICRDDVYAIGGGPGKLAQAMLDVYGEGNATVDFVPAMNNRTGKPYLCRNGQQYGIGMVHRFPDRDRHSGWYAGQDRGTEVRAWNCATLVPGRLTGCTTHLSIRPDQAMRQCHELMAILAAPWVQPEVIVSGDFNLRTDGGPQDIRDCTREGYDRRDDGTLQHVFFAGGVQWLHGEAEKMQFTDHPLLYERFRI